MNNFSKTQRIIEEILNEALQEQESDRVFGTTFISPVTTPAKPENKKEKLKGSAAIFPRENKRPKQRYKYRIRKNKSFKAYHSGFW